MSLTRPNKGSLLGVWVLQGCYKACDRCDDTVGLVQASASHTPKKKLSRRILCSSRTPSLMSANSTPGQSGPGRATRMRTNTRGLSDPVKAPAGRACPPPPQPALHCSQLDRSRSARDCTSVHWTGGCQLQAIHSINTGERQLPTLVGQWKQTRVQISVHIELTWNEVNSLNSANKSNDRIVLMQKGKVKLKAWWKKVYLYRNII